MCYWENQVWVLKARLIRAHEELRSYKNKRCNYCWTKDATKSEKAALTRLIKKTEKDVAFYIDGLKGLRRHVEIAPSHEQITYLLHKTCAYSAGEYKLPDNKNGFLKREDYTKTHLNYLDSLN